jgi:PAS domain S-box-containing protein
MKIVALLLLQSLIIIWLAVSVWHRRKAQEALKKSENTLKRAQKVAGMGFWESDFDSGRLSWSEEVFELFRLAPEQFGATREEFFARVHPDDRERVCEAFRRAMQGEQEYSLDHRIVLPGGAVRYVHEQAELMRNASGKPSGMLGVVVDISRQKQAEEEREALRQLSQQLTLPVTLKEVGQVVARTSRRLFRHDAFHLSYYDWARSIERGIYFEDTFDEALAPSR